MHAGYLSQIFKPEYFQRTVDLVAVEVEKLRNTGAIDSIAFTGISGGGVGFAVAYKLSIPMVCIRKPEIGSHGLNVEMSRGGIHKCVIIDDFISSGDTMDRVFYALDLNGFDYPKIILYRGGPGNNISRYKCVDVIDVGEQCFDMEC